MIPRILLVLALIASVVGVSAWTFRTITRAIEKRRSIFQTGLKDGRHPAMGQAEVAFRMGKFARQLKRLAAIELAGGVSLAGLGCYGTFELVRRLLSETFAAFLQDGISVFYFAAPFFVAYGLYVVTVSRKALKNR